MSWKDEFPKESRYFETENGILYKGNFEDIVKNINPELINLIVTDPPYKQIIAGGGCMKKNFEYRKKELEEISNFEPDLFLEYLSKFKNLNAYIFCNKGLLYDYLKFCNDNKVNFNMLILSKTNPVPAKNNNYLSDIEYCIFMKKGKVVFNNKLDYKYYYKVFRYNTSIVNDKRHPTIKPLEFIKKIIMVSSKENDIVLDLFMGSGTTAVACEILNRRWIGVEIKDNYCDLSKERILRAIKDKKSNLKHFID